MIRFPCFKAAPETRNLSQGSVSPSFLLRPVDLPLGLLEIKRSLGDEQSPFSKVTCVFADGRGLARPSAHSTLRPPSAWSHTSTKTGRKDTEMEMAFEAYCRPEALSPLLFPDFSLMMCSRWREMETAWSPQAALVLGRVRSTGTRVKPGSGSRPTWQTRDLAQAWAQARRAPRSWHRSVLLVLS